MEESIKIDTRMSGEVFRRRMSNSIRQELSEYVYERAAHPDNLYVDEFPKKKEYN